MRVDFFFFFFFFFFSIFLPLLSFCFLLLCNLLVYWSVDEFVGSFVCVIVFFFALIIPIFNYIEKLFLGDSSSQASVVPRRKKIKEKKKDFAISLLLLSSAFFVY